MARKTSGVPMGEEAENAAASLVTLNTLNTERQEYFTATQGQMIWRRCKKHKLALIGDILLALFLFTVVFSEFIAVYGLRIRNVDYILGAAAKCRLNVEHLRRFPHAFSAGQRQRIGIARGLVLNPRFVVCDEPISSLDVSVQAEIINLLQELQEELGLTYLFIAHDLSVVEHICDRIAVMYLGKIVEISDGKTLFRRPRHSYTEALMSAIPQADPREKMRPVFLEGEIPNPMDPPSGCAFHPRCRYARDICRREGPVLGFSGTAEGGGRGGGGAAGRGAGRGLSFFRGAGSEGDCANRLTESCYFDALRI